MEITLTVPSLSPLPAIRKMFRSVRKRTKTFLNTYVFTPFTLVPAYVLLAVLSLGVLVSSEPYDGPARVFAGTALLLVGVGAGWQMRVRQQVIHADQVELALLAAEDRAAYADKVQVQVMELKHRVNRLYNARKVRINNTGPQRIVGKYAIRERELP